jgi:transposase
MWIIGCDIHSRYQQIAALDKETGEMIERRLNHEGDEVLSFYASLPPGARVGIEATCPAPWFERILQRCGHELWIGDPATIRLSVVRKQKTDARDAQQLLDLLRTDRFPCIWIPSPAERDLRQLLVHRHKLVCWRTQVWNQLRALARGQGLVLRRCSWTTRGRQNLEALALDPWAACRRQHLLGLLDHLNTEIDPLTHHIEQEAKGRPEAVDLMQEHGVGPQVSLAFVLTLGRARRFPRGKQVVSYLGLNPTEHSSGGHQKLGHISKQGNRMMRWLLVEAAWVATRKDDETGRFFKRLAFRRGHKIAIVAVARKLAVKLYWRLRNFQEQNSAAPAPMQGSSGRGLVHTPTL